MAKKLLFIVIFSFISSTISAKSALTQLYKGKPWEFIEDTFIIKPENDLQSFKGKSIRWGIPALSSLAVLYATYKLTSSSDEQDSFSEIESMNPLLRGLIMATSSLATAGISYKVIDEIYRKNNELKALEKFIKNWPENKNYTPSSLQSVFDSLYNTHKTDSDAFKEDSQEIIRLVRKVILEHFPERYNQKNSGKKDFFTAKFFNSVISLDVGSTLNGLANLLGILKKNKS